MVVTPWTATVRERTLIVVFPEQYRVMSWAPLSGGLVAARTILNHQVNLDDAPVSEEPGSVMQNLAQQLGVEHPVVGLMTGVFMERLVRKIVQQRGLTLECFATVGLSNALAVGDAATYEEQIGTINLIVAIDQSLTVPALMEAVQIVTEAKVAALYTAQIQSAVSPAFATGTGTDCVAIACPIATPAYHYCGKHTKLGELIGQVTLQAVREGIRKTTSA